MVKIFLAEDNRSDVYLLREALREHHVEYELHVAPDGEQALEYIEQVSTGVQPIPDVFLLDLNLPKITGEELVVAIRSERKLDLVPVVVVSSSDSPEDRETIQKLGASRYVRKPCLLEDFFRIGAIVKEMCGGRTATAG